MWYQNILFKYIIRQMLSSMMVIGGGLLLLIIVLDFVELLNKMSGIAVPIQDLLVLELLKIADLIQSSLPYIILFSFMHGFYKLNVNNEIPAARSAGFSIFQFIIPASVLAGILGVIFTVFINNFAILTYQLYQEKYDKYHDKVRTLIEVTPTGVWLKEKTNTGYRIINGGTINEKTKVIKDANIIELYHDKTLALSYSADTAQLKDNEWLLTKVYTTNKENFLSFNETLLLPTKNTLQNLQKVFYDVNAVSFWSLPKQISLLQEAGFNTAEYKFMLFYLLSMPLLFISLAFLAAFFCAQPFGRRSKKHTIVIGIFCGFGLFFYLNFVRSLVFITPIAPEILGLLPALSAVTFSFFLLLSAEKTHL